MFTPTVDRTFILFSQYTKDITNVIRKASVVAIAGPMSPNILIKIISKIKFKIALKIFITC